jgi:hypothetical protein
VVVDAIVLAFSHSEARDVVGTDALRMVLDGRYVEMVKAPGALQLQPLYDLLKVQPGFVHQQSLPPFCRIKAWEPQLGAAIELPRELAELSASVIERERQAARCKVPDEELSRVLRPQAAPVPAPVARAPTGPVKMGLPDDAPPASKRKTMAALGLATAAAVGLMVSLVLVLSGGPRKIVPSEISDVIPIASAKLSGPVVGIELADKSWLSRPEAERRRQLEDALARVQPLGASRIVVLDQEGRLHSSAAFEDGAPVVKLTP